jgi:hypothetical protein
MATWRLVESFAMPVSFAADIQPLFRERDRKAMLFVLDLWSYEDVRDDAENVLDRIDDGTMPCDAPWDAKRIALMRRWIDDGCPA